MTSLVSPNSKPKIDSAKFALGILTKSASMPETIELRSSAIRRAERYALQNAAVKLLPEHRVRTCLRYRISSDKPVSVKYNEKRKQAHYCNIMRCGSVWVCPVCAAKISEKRKQELVLGMSNFRKMGGNVLLLTLTNPHHQGDNLADLLYGQKKALKRFWSDRKSKLFFKEADKFSHITATEVTHGKNGWHPHYHILLLFNSTVNIEKMRDFIAHHWQDSCKQVGLKVPSIEHGCDLRNGSYAEKYISKWGLEDEMTKGHIKKGNQGNATPFDLLRLSDDGCQKSGRLFIEYTQAFKGHSQVYWPNLLKKKLGVIAVTDETIANETEQDSVEIKIVALEIWRLIKRYNVRADYLKAVEHDYEFESQRADNLIMDLADRYVKENIHELMKNADHWELSAELRSYS